MVRLTVDVRPGERLVLEYAPPASPALGRGALGPPPQTARQFDGRRVVTGVAWAVAVVVLIAVVGALAAVLGLAAPAVAAVNTTPTGPTYSVDNQDEVNTTNGFVDLPF